MVTVDEYIKLNSVPEYRWDGELCENVPTGDVVMSVDDVRVVINMVRDKERERWAEVQGFIKRFRPRFEELVKETKEWFPMFSDEEAEVRTCCLGGVFNDALGAYLIRMAENAVKRYKEEHP